MDSDMFTTHLYIGFDMIVLRAVRPYCQWLEYSSSTCYMLPLHKLDTLTAERGGL